MKELMDLLFAQIEHGDAEHRQWLRDKLTNFAKEVDDKGDFLILKWDGKDLIDGRE